MSKIDDITRIISKTLEKYRNSIPRKAFIQAMEEVVALTVEPGETRLQSALPGVEIIKRPDVTAGELAALLSGACPPFCCADSAVHCDNQSCRACWLAWLATGLPPEGGNRHE